MVNIGIVGAGVSGLTCAWRLFQRVGEGTHAKHLVNNLSITIFEWGRGPGGRTARKRVKVDVPAEFGGGQRELFFDHGAPFFELSEDVLQRTAWADLGLIAEWKAGVRIGGSRTTKPLYVGVPESNNALCKGLLDEVEKSGAVGTRFGRHVRSAVWQASNPALPGNAGADGGTWKVIVENRLASSPEDRVENCEFDYLILSDKLAFWPGQTYSIFEEAAVRQLGIVEIVDQLLLQQAVPRKTFPPDSQQKETSSSCLVMLVALLQRRRADAEPVELDEATCANDEQRGSCLPDAQQLEDADITVFQDSDVLDFAVKENGKPSRQRHAFRASAESDVEILQFVVHSKPEYASKHLVWKSGEGSIDTEKTSEEEILEEMWEAFTAGPYPPTWSGKDVLLHRSLFVWDHAKPSVFVQESGLGSIGAESANAKPERTSTSYLSEADNMAAIGDYFLGNLLLQGREASSSGVDNAARSGLDLADRLANLLEVRFSQSNI